MWTDGQTDGFSALYSRFNCNHVIVYLTQLVYMVPLDLNLKKLECELHAALHKPKNIRCVSVSTREADDVPTTRGV